MGERDPGLAPAPEPPPWPQRAVLAAVLAALAAAVLVLPLAEPGAALPAALATQGLAGLAAWIAPARGPAFLGALMLALAAALACRPLERRIGRSAALLVAVLVFGSAVWALVWERGAELAPLALAVAAFALAYGGGESEQPEEIYRESQAGRRAVLRWLAVGLLLAELVPSSPLLAALLLPAALAVPPEARRRGLPALLAGWAAGVALEVAIQGHPVVSGPLVAAAEAYRPDPAATGWNLLFLAAGRNVGLLAGYAPLLLLLATGRAATTRPALAPVCLILALAGAVALPFDFAAGWIHLPFLPLYGALWLLPARPPRAWEWLAALLLAGLATWPLWTPAAVAPASGNGVVLTGSWPRRLLPYETTLRALPARGEIRLGRDDLLLRVLAGCRLLDDAGRLELTGADGAELFLAAPASLEMVALEFGPGAPSSLEVGGAELGRTVFRPDGRIGFELRLTRPRARHALWLGDGRFAGHLITLRLPGGEMASSPLRFRVLAAQP